MGFLKKLAFWKKDDFSLNDFHNSNLGINSNLGMDNSSLGLNNMQQNANIGSQNNNNMPLDSYSGSQGFDNSFDNSFEAANNSFAQNPLKGIDFSKAKVIEHPDSHVPKQNDLDYVHEKNMEIISSKLDAIKSALEAINQRLINIERLANAEQRQKPLW